MPGLALCPISRDDACAFIRQHHRHHPPPQGWKFGVAVHLDGRIVGVVMVGRPVARKLDDGWTLEVTRSCTTGEQNACSKLSGAVRRAAAAQGYRRLITYTGAEEPGTSLRAAGWVEAHETPGRSWNVASRPRTDAHELGARRAWMIMLGDWPPPTIEAVVQAPPEASLWGPGEAGA